MCSTPPAGTTIFLVLSSGSAIRMPPGGGRRLPWRSLMARMRNSTGAAVWAIAREAGALFSQHHGRNERDKRVLRIEATGDSG